jgi:hypothetical protein
MALTWSSFTDTGTETLAIEKAALLGGENGRGKRSAYGSVGIGDQHSGIDRLFEVV